MSNVPAHAERGARSGRRPALVRLVLVTVLVYVGTIVVLVSCAAPHATEPPHVSSTPRSPLAQAAELLAQRMGSSGHPGPDARRARDRAAKAGPSRAEARTSRPRTATTARGRTRAGSAPVEWRELLDLADRRGDAGAGPPYADLTALRLAGSSRGLRITVATAGRPPSALAAHAVEGIGIDFYRSRADESDHQVFLDGGSYGWRAFLQTPHGYVRFPGTFAVDRRHFVIDVPWSAVGGRRPSEVSAFADWSGGDGASSADTVPRSRLRIG